MKLLTGLIVIFIVFAIFTSIKTFVDNENSEVLSEEAYVRRKINSSHMDANGVMSTTLTITFSLKDKDKDIKCIMRHKDYRNIPNNTKGILTHKGTRFISFEFDGKRIER